MREYHSPKDRNDHACTLLLAAVERALPREAEDILGKVTCSLFIVVDELGSTPKFLRAMCGAGLQMIKLVQQRFHNKNCELMAGGTGANGFAIRVGSLPGTYLLVPLPTDTTEVWEAITTRITDEPGRSVVAVLRENPTALQLATNPRMAAIMFDHLTRKVSILGLEPLPRAIKNILPVFLARGI